MSFQTSYAEQARAYAGMISDGGDKRVDSYVNGEASAEIPFGIFVAKGAAPAQAGGYRKAIMMAASSDIPAGLVLHSHTYSKPTELGDTGVKIKCPLTIMRRGRAWAKCGEALAVDTTPYIRYATGTGTQIGELFSTADTATCLKTRGITVVEAALAAGLVLVEFDMETVERALRGVTGY